jgi:hypothetical protein
VVRRAEKKHTFRKNTLRSDQSTATLFFQAPGDRPENVAGELTVSPPGGFAAPAGGVVAVAHDSPESDRGGWWFGPFRDNEG